VPGGWVTFFTIFLQLENENWKKSGGVFEASLFAQFGGEPEKVAR
jgi:hypothetical protein